MLRASSTALLVLAAAPAVRAQSVTASSSPPPAASAAPSASPAPSSSPPPSATPPPSASASPHPRLDHLPPARAEANVPILLTMDVTHPQLVRRIEVHFRAPGGPWTMVAAQRATSGYAAEIPAQPVSARAVEYFVRVRLQDETAYDAFASQSNPFPIVVQPSGESRTEARELAYNDGQRLEFAAGAEYTDFGNVDGTHCGMTSSDRCADNWYSIFGSVRYHFFRTVRSVSVRTERLIGVTTRTVNGQLAQTDVGLFAATVGIELRLAPGVSWWLGGILGANQTSVTGGGATYFEFGVGTPTRIQLAFNGIVDYGISASAWMRWYTLRKLPLGAGVEVTNQPGGGNDWGVRGLLEAGHTFGRYFTLTLRGGYGLRNIHAGGFTGAAVATVHF